MCARVCFLTIMQFKRNKERTKYNWTGNLNFDVIEIVILWFSSSWKSKGQRKWRRR